jgi:purine-cytosine permease-like protein
MTELAPFIMFISAFIVTAVIIVSVLNYKLKKRYIDNGYLNADSVDSLTNSIGLKNDTLKWGIILIFGGVGLLIINFLPYDANRSSVPCGVEAIFIGLGFLLYYNLTKNIK